MARDTAALVERTGSRPGSLVRAARNGPVWLWLACLAPAQAAAAAPAIDFPASAEGEALRAWVASHTDLPAGELVSLTPTGAVAISPAQPQPSAARVRVRIRIETLDRGLATQDGAVSWRSSAEVECKARRLRFGEAVGYARRGGQGAAVTKAPAEAAWREPTDGQTSAAIWRALCAPPTAGRSAAAAAPAPANTAAREVVSSAGSDVAPAAAAPAAAPPPAVRRTEPARAPPAPARSTIDRSVRVQVAAFPTQPEAEGFRTRFMREHGGLVGNRPIEIEPTANGRQTVYRLLITGFVGPGEARQVCAALVAAKHACFVRSAVRR